VTFQGDQSFEGGRKLDCRQARSDETGQVVTVNAFVVGGRRTLAIRQPRADAGHETSARPENRTVGQK